MAKKKRKLSPEFRAYLEARHEETSRLLEERIAYHKAKAAQERAEDAGRS